MKYSRTLPWWAVPTLLTVGLLTASVAWAPISRHAVPVEPSCETLTVEQQVAAADVIMTGSVFIVIPAQNGAEVIIDPVKIYRGQIATPTVRIAAATQAAGSGSGVVTHSSSINFASSQPPYLLFLQAQSDGTYTTSVCAGTRFLGIGLTTEEAAILGEGTPINRPE